MLEIFIDDTYQEEEGLPELTGELSFNEDDFNPLFIDEDRWEEGYDYVPPS